MSRAPQSPALPSKPLPFTLHFMRDFGGWYALALLLQIGASSSAIAVPWVIGSIIRAVTAGGHDDVRHALMMFVRLGVAELLCARGAGNAHMHIAPLVRGRVTPELFAYIQHHSHRYFTDRFAGALAHRISDTSNGVMQANNAILFVFLPVMVKIAVAASLFGHANPKLALFVLDWAAVFIGVAYVLAWRCRPYMRAHAAGRSHTIGQVTRSPMSPTSACSRSPTTSASVSAACSAKNSRRRAPRSAISIASSGSRTRPAWC